MAHDVSYYVLWGFSLAFKGLEFFFKGRNDIIKENNSLPAQNLLVHQFEVTYGTALFFQLFILKSKSKSISPTRAYVQVGKMDFDFDFIINN